MINFILAGGYMMIVILVIGIGMLIVAAKFARNASAQGLSLIRALTVATVVASIAGVAADLAAVGRALATEPELQKELVSNLLMGFNEAMAPAILGFSILAITWILVAFGVRRMPNN